MDHLTTADQGILARLVKITFLGEVETVVRLGNKVWFGNVGPSRGESTIRGMLSLFLTIYMYIVDVSVG